MRTIPEARGIDTRLESRGIVASLAMHSTATRTELLDLKLAPVEHLLFRGADVAAAQFRCPQAHPHFHGTGPLRNWIVGFPRRAARLRREGAPAFVADPNTVVFLNPGDCYTREALGDEPDHSDLFALSERALRSCMAEVAPRWSEGAAPRFPVAWAPLAASSYLGVRRVFDAAARDGGGDPLALEESSLCILGDVIAAAAGSRGGSARGTRQRRVRRDLVEEAKVAIAAHVGEPLALATLAERVHSSPFHLARSFRAATGSSIHQYLLRLRVNRSLELLRDGLPVCDVALRLGFAAHSHFTETFVRHFGLTPSAWMKRRTNHSAT